MDNDVDLEKYIQNSEDIYIVSKSSGEICYANKNVHQVFDIPKDVVPKNKIHIVTHPKDLAKEALFLNNAYKEPKVSFKETIRYLSKTGKILTILWVTFFDQESESFFHHGRITNQEEANKSLLDDEFKKIALLGSWEYDLETQEISWDTIVYDLYELDHSTEISLQRMMQFFREESKTLFKIKFNELINSGKLLDLELNFISGKFRPSTARFIARLSGENSKKKIIGTIQDFTDLRHIERKAEDYQEAVDKSSIVSITDRSGTITEVNDKFCEISKYSRKELIGQNHSILDSGFHGINFWKEMWTCINNGNVWRGEIKNKNKDNDIFWVDTTIVPFKNSSGRIYQFLSIQKDFTENKRLNEELMVSEKLSSIGEITAQIMHEVMTPLSIISLSIENLEDNIEASILEKRQADKVNSNLNEIKLNYNRIDEIFNNMRSVLVREDNATAILGIRESFEKTLTLVNAKLKSKKVSLFLDQIIPSHQIQCSQSDLHQIFLNLINNSCDAIDHLPDRWIRVSTHIEGENTILKFQDSGPGIPAEIQKNIFDNLFTTKGEKRGTGLGLGVCKKLIQRHKGSISIDSSQINTTFNLTFPNIN